MGASGRAAIRLVVPSLLLLAVVPRVPAQPRNDACVDRTYVTFLPYADRESVAAATIAPGETTPACAAAPADHSVWYALPPPIDGLYLFSTCGSDFDTALQLWDGAFCNTLTPHDGGCNDDSDLCGRGSQQSAVILRLPRGPASIVHAQATSVGATAGTLRFQMQLVPRARNDLCTAARLIRAGVFAETLDAADTGADAADLDMLAFCGAVGTVMLGAAPHSVWYRYTAPQPGPVAIDPTGTTTPVALAVFEETPQGCALLGARIACGANGPITFGADGGKTYRIYVAVPERVQPDVLRIRLTGPNGPPVAAATGPVVAGPGATVVLDGTASRDPDGDALVYHWQQDDGPPVVLQDANSATARFTVPDVPADTSLAFTLAVSDGEAFGFASVTVPVRLDAADYDGDGVTGARDQCPDTGPGRAVDATGCACDDPGHVPCTADAAACVLARCDGSTAACVAARAPAGTACADDGDACTRDRCTADGRCAHERLQSFAGAACDLDVIAARVVADQLADAVPRLVRLLSRSRFGVSTAEASAAVGDQRRAGRRLRSARRMLRRFANVVASLEARRRIPSPAAGRLLDGAAAVATKIEGLYEDLGGTARRR